MTHRDQIAPQWLTLKGAARYSGLSVRTVENYSHGEIHRRSVQGMRDDV